MTIEQKAIFIRVIIGAFLTIIVLILPFVCPVFLPLSSVQLFFLSLLIPTLMYCLGIIRVANLRFLDEKVTNPILQHNTEKLIIYRQYLQNTLEQLVLALITYATLCFVLPLGSLYLILLLSLLFGIGRILFMLGYAKGGSGRAFGFALTFYPNILGFLLGVIILLFTL